MNSTTRYPLRSKSQVARGRSGKISNSSKPNSDTRESRARERRRRSLRPRKLLEKQRNPSPSTSVTSFTSIDDKQDEDYIQSNSRNTKTKATKQNDGVFGPTSAKKPDSNSSGSKPGTSSTRRQRGGSRKPERKRSPSPSTSISSMTSVDEKQDLPVDDYIQGISIKTEPTEHNDCVFGSACPCPLQTASNSSESKPGPSSSMYANHGCPRKPGRKRSPSPSTSIASIHGRPDEDDIQSIPKKKKINRVKKNNDATDPTSSTKTSSSKPKPSRSSSKSRNLTQRRKSPAQGRKSPSPSTSVAPPVEDQQDKADTEPASKKKKTKAPKQNINGIGICGPTSAMKPSDYKYICGGCKKEFVNASKLALHFERKQCAPNGQSIDEVTITVKKITEDRTEISCPFNKLNKFANLQSFYRHCQRTHKEYGELFEIKDRIHMKCIFCKIKFLHPKQFHSHLKVAGSCPKWDAMKATFNNLSRYPASMLPTMISTLPPINMNNF